MMVESFGNLLPFVICLPKPQVMPSLGLLVCVGVHFGVCVNHQKKQYFHKKNQYPNIKKSL